MTTYNEKCIELLEQMIEKETDQDKAKIYVDELFKIKDIGNNFFQPNVILQGKVKSYALRTENNKRKRF